MVRTVHRVKSVRFDLRATTWVERSIGEGARVVRARRLRGGVSSVVHEVALVDRSWHRTNVVLRRVPFWNDVPDHDPAAEVRADAGILARLDGQAGAPTVIAVDVSGAACGAPSVLMSRLPGRPIVAPRDVEGWVRGLAEAVRLVRSAAVDVSQLAAFTAWMPPSEDPPAWSRSPERWVDARRSLHASPARSRGDGFIHRDLHPGNVLFRHGALSGIVDWTHAARGPVEADISRCRVEIAILAGMDAADAFLDACAYLADDYDRRWDALVALELSPWTEELLEFNRLGASLTVGGIRRICDELVIASAR